MTHFTVVLEQAAQPITGQEVMASNQPPFETKNNIRLSALVIPVGTWERKSCLGKSVMSPNHSPSRLAPWTSIWHHAVPSA